MNAGSDPFSVASTSSSTSAASARPLEATAPPFAATTAAQAPAQQAPAPAPKPATCLDRSQILDATARVLRERGYDGTTIRTIAKQLDCAVGSIYRYFKDKRALLDAVCQRRFESVAEHAEMRMPLSRTVLMYARTAAEQPEQYRLMYWLNSVGRRQHGEALPGIIRRIISGWAETLGDQAAARRLWAQLHGCIELGLDAEQTITMLDLPASPEPAPAQAESKPAEAYNDTIASSILKSNGQ